jgi:hypothetical protein
MYKIITAVFLLCGITCFGKNFYVSSSGNDTDGLTPEKAFKTIDKLNATWTNINPGDSILFHRGETFYGSIIVQKNGSLNNSIKFGAYGVGADPIITGLKTITGWVNLGGNIWEAPTPGALKTPNLVLRNSVQMQVGRYPNTNAAEAGYLTYTASTNTSITGPALSTTTNWTNAEVVVRWARWATFRRKVTSHSAGVVNFANSNDKPKVGYGYFFQRDPRTLDRDGEWYQDSVNNKLRMYFGNNNPSAYTIQQSSVDTLCYNRRSDISFYNLKFVGANKCDIMNNGGTRILMQDLTSVTSGGEAFVTWFATDVTARRCNVTNALGGSIRLYGASTGIVNVLAEYNTVRNSSLIVGMELNGVGSAGRGITVRGGDNVTAQYNTIINSGYNGLEWNGNNALIYRNYIDSFCSSRDDGGGIYTFEAPGYITVTRTNRKIRANIIVNGIGAPYGVASLGTDAEGIMGRFSVSGIYNDEGTKSVLMDSNTIAYVPYHAIQGNNNQSMIVRANTAFNCGISFAQQRLTAGERQTGFLVRRNIWYPYRTRVRDQALNKPPPGYTQTQMFNNLGVLDSNYYSIKSGADTSVIIQTTDSGGANYSRIYKPFTYLQTILTSEAGSLKFDNSGVLTYNNSTSVKTFAFPGYSKKDVYGTVYNNSAAIPAWQSKVLLDNGVITPVPQPPTVDAGGDRHTVLPDNTVTLNATASDFDGSIVSQLWTKISGPTSYTITSPTSLLTPVTDLVEGTYQFRIVVTDNSGLKDTAIAIVFVHPEVLPDNTPPRAEAGEDQIWPYGTTSTTLYGSGTDPEGPVTFDWTMIAGPGASILTPTAGTTIVEGLTTGTYIFQITVTDNLGATTIDNVTVTIQPQPGNVPPIIKFQDRKVLPTGTTSTSLSVEATDTDGSISSYSWTGGVGTIVSPGAATTLVTGLTEGDHTFTVTVTDNLGASSSIDIVVTVVPRPDIPRSLTGARINVN